MDSFEEVLFKLDEVIEESISINHNGAIFALLYRQTTRRIQLATEQGFFEDAQRMERFDVVFANKYFFSYDKYRLGEAGVSNTWKFTFDACADRKLLIFQNLLLGMNTHINIDLALAAVETCENEDLLALKSDFMKVTELLEWGVDQVQYEINKLSPLFGLMDKIFGSLDESMLKFSIKVAREASWNLALKLKNKSNSERLELLLDYEKNIIELGKKIMSPWFGFHWIGTVIKIFEVKDLGKISARLRKEPSSILPN